MITSQAMQTVNGFLREKRAVSPSALATRQSGGTRGGAAQAWQGSARQPCMEQPALSLHAEHAVSPGLPEAASGQQGRPYAAHLTLPAPCGLTPVPHVPPLSSAHRTGRGGTALGRPKTLSPQPCSAPRLPGQLACHSKGDSTGLGHSYSIDQSTCPHPPSIDSPQHRPPMYPLTHPGIHPPTHPSIHPIDISSASTRACHCAGHQGYLTLWS